MRDLVEALNIFLKYADYMYPTQCEKELLIIAGIDERDVLREDIERLEKLGFFWFDESKFFASYRYGRL
jgi:hypothetical protein